jgi:hypothetical protein
MAASQCEVFAPVALDRPPFDQLAAWAPLLRGPDWPSLDALGAALDGLVHPDTGATLRLVAQDRALLADGMHFEERVHDRGAIATRARSWHDLFGALAWARFPRLKLALNRLQVAELRRAGTRQRSRWQQALTHLDEGGVLVASCDDALLDAIDAHDWETVFWHARFAWSTRLDVRVFGHALFELLLEPHLTLAGKAVRCRVDAGYFAWPAARRDALLDAAVADAVLARRVAADPKDMPSLPLSGIPGWRDGADTLEFIRTAPCFRGRPEGRVYAEALEVRLA